MNDNVLGAPPRQRLRPWHIILIAVGGIGLFVGVLFYFVMSVTGPVVAGGDRFMTALKGGDFEQAYAASTPELQREMGSPERMSEHIDRFRPTEWSWSHRAIRNGIGELDGTVSFTGPGGPTQGPARLELLQVDGEWRVSAFRFGPT